MKKNLTYLIFVVDRSGSMSTIARDMIGGYNTFIKTQKDAKLGDCKVFFYQFDTQYEAVYEGTDLNAVPELTDKTFIPRGGTALYSSLGKTINSIGKRLSDMPEDERPERVLFITITDGYHNSILEGEDKQYDAKEVKEMIVHQTEKYGWDFVYIGANQDAWAIGDAMGIAGNTKFNYVASAAGTAYMFDTLTRSATAYRASVQKKSFDFDDAKEETDSTSK